VYRCIAAVSLEKWVSCIAGAVSLVLYRWCCIAGAVSLVLYRWWMSCIAGVLYRFPVSLSCIASFLYRFLYRSLKSGCPVSVLAVSVLGVLYRCSVSVLCFTTMARVCQVSPSC
jgi:hypothetical protein